MPSFESEYDIKDLVKFRDNKDSDPKWGVITDVRFFRRDAVNNAVVYTIQILNTKDFASSVDEQLIDCKYEEQA